MVEYKSTKSITSWAEEDRPREKLMLKGKLALSDAELIAILMGSGNREQSAVELARDILGSINNDLNQLAKVGVKDLMKFKGVGEAKAISIVAALELGRRRKEGEATERPRLGASILAYELLKPYMLDLLREEFWILLLDKNNRLLKTLQISTGGVASTLADPKLIFKPALDHLASGIILAHNHPSGNLEPSHDDLRLTKRLATAGRILEITVVDHIIFTDDSYFSFRDRELL